MAEFHRKTRGIVVLHRCILNPGRRDLPQSRSVSIGSAAAPPGCPITQPRSEVFSQTNLVATVPRRMAELEASNPAIKILNQRLARSSWLAKLPGIRITLILDDRRIGLGFDTFRPRAFDFPPEGRPGHSSGHVKHLGNFLPVKSSAMRAKHGSTLIRKLVTKFLQTPVGEL
jgi:hypothetical protein